MPLLSLLTHTFSQILGSVRSGILLIGGMLYSIAWNMMMCKRDH